MVITVYCLYAWTLKMHKIVFLLLFQFFWHVAMLQKFAGPLVGAPVRLNMPNMPKSASEQGCDNSEW